MSNSHLFLPSGFLRAPLKNGLGRYVCQLQRVTIKFCKHHGSSLGVRSFIENDLLKFAEENPGVVVYVKPRRHRAPALVAEYLNGGRDYLSCSQMERDEVLKWIEYMKNKSGNPIIRYYKYHHTDYPSIQGPWTPFTHRTPESNLEAYPNVEASELLHQPQSASDKLIEIFNHSVKISPSEEKQ
uniref:Large ribosomal subunit protein mL43 n=1 Tax=Lynceus sp. MCZ IZ 141354 TaxID=1930659 RepID=A0A9N6WZ04_9CRUS|nr:EOG090X0FS9 [Lynceus sp. MCZ IZ 141354]